MDDLQAEIEQWVRTAAERVLGRPVADVMLRVGKGGNGDFSSSLAMAEAKAAGRPPRDIANAVRDALSNDEACRAALTKVEVAGPGFINLSLANSVVNRALSKVSDDDRLGVSKAKTPTTVVLDYSSPNLAKEMHVGHLRSTIIGDAICRLLTFSGDRVIRQNHLGDWGTQFGMLLEHLVDSGWSPAKSSSISDLDQLYQLAKARFDADSGFAERARQRVVALQSGEEQSRALWNALIGESIRHMEAVYAQLGVLLEPGDIRPESFYNSLLPKVVSDLREVGLLVEDAEAQVVFPEGMLNKEGEPLPLFVQKRDGGYGYATTDLAAIRYRVGELGAKRVIYVVDARQADHFKMVFWTVRRAGWAGSDVALEHVPFGTILGADRKPFKTRAGGTVKLIELLDEACTRARAAIDEKNPDLPPEERERTAEAVGIGAVKYADLSSERIKDYAFDTERMLAFEGNTAPYLQNAYVRIRSIFRKAGLDEPSLAETPFCLEEPTERALALELLRLPRVIQAVATSLEPHRLCGYLYDVASSFHGFYHACRVLNAETEELKQSRLKLCAVTGRVLALGLTLLGLPVIDRM